MTTDNWTQFLLNQGADITDGRVQRYATTIAEEKRCALDERVICDLSHYGLIRARGEEAESFLQNQFCNDVRLVTATQSQLNAYCNPKGRVLAFFRLFKRDDEFYLRLPREMLEPTLKRLRMYVMMSKVTLEDCSDDLIHIAYAGPQAEQKLQEILGTAPTESNTVSQQDGLSIVRVVDSKPRFEIYGQPESLKTLWEKLAEDATLVGYGSWELLDIHAGIPEVLPETLEAFVPQMINLQAINALSFKKGCYPGQEIVARMHYLGKLKRRMYRAHVETDTPPLPGEALYAEDSSSGQGVGKVVRAQSHPNGGVDLLAVIEINSAEERGIHLKNADGPLMNLENLPYSVEEPE